MCVTMSPRFSSEKQLSPAATRSGPCGSSPAGRRRGHLLRAPQHLVVVRAGDVCVDSRALTPTTKSRCRAIASRAAPTSARARSIVSPSGRMPARPMLTSTRPGCGDALARPPPTSPIASAPAEPRVDPTRDAVREQQRRPFRVAARVRVDVDEAGNDELAASRRSFRRLRRRCLASTAAIGRRRSPRRAPRRAARTDRCTRPPLISRSYFSSAASMPEERASSAPLTAAESMNRRRFSMSVPRIRFAVCRVSRSRCRSIRCGNCAARRFSISARRARRALSPGSLRPRETPGRCSRGTRRASSSAASSPSRSSRRAFAPWSTRYCTIDG